MTQTNKQTKVQRKIAFKPNVQVINNPIPKEKTQLDTGLKVRLIGLPDEIKKGKQALIEVLQRSYLTETVTCNMLTEKEVGEILKGYHVDLKTIETNKYEMKGREDHLKEARFALLEADRKSDKKEVKFPSTWEPQISNCELKLVQQSSSEWKSVIDTVDNKAIKVVKLERIQNQWLYKKYYHELENTMTKNNTKDGNEKLLFHGTHNTAPEQIYNGEEGFDMRFSLAGMWGNGIYFAQTSTYSARYGYQIPNRKQKQLFLSTVVCGFVSTMASDSSLKMPPERPTSDTSIQFAKPRYDSVSGTTDGTQVYIIYSNSKAYPLYLITFEDK